MLNILIATLSKTEHIEFKFDVDSQSFSTPLTVGSLIVCLDKSLHDFTMTAFDLL